jgi:cation transport ATPase
MAAWLPPQSRHDAHHLKTGAPQHAQCRKTSGPVRRFTCVGYGMSQLAALVANDRTPDAHKRNGRRMQRHRARIARHHVRRVCALIISLFAVLMATVAWLSWILMSGLLGLPGATFASAILLLGAAALSARSGRGFADSLVMVGCGSFILLTAALFGIAGYTLIFGE